MRGENEAAWLFDNRIGWNIRRACHWRVAGGRFKLPRVADGHRYPKLILKFI